MKDMPVDSEVEDITAQKTLNLNVLDVNAIPPERKDLWTNNEDNDCEIIDLPDRPPRTPSPEPETPEDVSGPFKMRELLTHPMTLRELYVSFVSVLNSSRSSFARGVDMEHKTVSTQGLPILHFREGIALKGFQKLAVAFLLLSREKYRFALLGDEMGVGKVIHQLSAF